jgi:hypothetical protein
MLGPSSHSNPNHLRQSIYTSKNSSLSYSSLVFSFRSTNMPTVCLAYNKLNNPLLMMPIWRKEVGLDVNLTLTTLLIFLITSDLSELYFQTAYLLLASTSFQLDYTCSIKLNNMLLIFSYQRFLR